MKIIPVCRPSLPKLKVYEKQIKHIWETKMLSNFSFYSSKLESIAQKYLGIKNIISVTNADMGLIISLSILDLPKGSEVILPSFTFNSTANAVIWNGLKPVFADIDKETFCIDPKDVEKKITENTKVILATHIFGSACDVNELQKISKKHKLKLIFDSAHGYGSLYNGKKVGTLGDIEVFSLSGTKVVTSAEGGLIATKDNVLFQKLKLARNYGFDSDYNSKTLGMNGKISELNAALGCLNLTKVEKFVTLRNKLAEKYKNHLQGVGDIKFQKIPTKNLSTHKDFAILTSRRDDLFEYLNTQGIQTKKYFYPIHMMDYYLQHQTYLPVTEAVYNKILCLPIYNDLTENDFKKVVNAIKKFYKE